VRPNSAVAATSWSGLQLLFGLPPTRPPRPAANAMIAFTEGWFWLESAMAAQPPADWPITIALSGAANFCTVM